MHNQIIIVLVDSQGATKSFIQCTVTSITVLNFIKNLNQLGKQNHASIAWISGHAGVHGKEVALYLAKSGSKSKMHGPNLLLQSRMPVLLARLILYLQGYFCTLFVPGGSKFAPYPKTVW